jgi:nitroreductase
MLGWKTTRLDSVSDIDMSILLGLSQDKRFFESEVPDMLFIISPEEVNSNTCIDSLINSIPLLFDGVANKLSPVMQDWEIIPAIENATKEDEIPQKEEILSIVKRDPTRESKDVVLNRRSVHVMQKESSHISKVMFHTLLKSVALSLDAKENSAHLCIFVHQVQSYESGLYILIRNNRDKEDLVSKMKQDFKWGETQLENLYLLETKDFTSASKAISCSQDIAKDGAFSLGMLCNFSEQLKTHGAHRYKELYWECGAIGQQLYLEATSMGLSGTGIGCFLDDDMHKVLGLKDNSFQILYHFTVGRGYVDSRILTKPAYN